MAEGEWDLWNSASVDLRAMRVGEEAKAAIRIVTRQCLQTLRHHIELIDRETEVVAGVRALPAPGHTPGHFALLLEFGRPPIAQSGRRRGPSPAPGTSRVGKWLRSGTGTRSRHAAQPVRARYRRSNARDGLPFSIPQHRPGGRAGAGWVELDARRIAVRELLARPALGVLQLALPHLDLLAFGFADHESAAAQILCFKQLVVRQR